MFHWLSQISTQLSLDEPVLIAVVCDVNGASPDGDRGMLVLTNELIATNIINDKRRDLIIGDAKKLLDEKKHWTEVAYPLGEVLSTANGYCRVVYQFFDATANHVWVHDAQTLIRAGDNVWLAFSRGPANSNSTIKALTEDEYASLHSQHEATDTADAQIAGDVMSGANLLRSSKEEILLLPVGAPADPVTVVGRHRVAIETIRLLCLLPLSVIWFAEKFIESDPKGPLVTRRSMFKLANEPPATGSVVIIMSNDHQQDLQLCKQALLQPGLIFAGCIGSARKAALLKEQLRVNGIPQSQLEKLHIPVGLPEITGKHPSVIAASVVAQILAVCQPVCDDQLTFIEY